MLDIIRAEILSLIAPDEDLLPVISYYLGLGLNDKKIVEHALTSQFMD